MHWSAPFVAASDLAVVSAEDQAPRPYAPGVPAYPFPKQAHDARVHIDATTACKTADDKEAPRNVQLAAWVECQAVKTYPYPRTDDPNDLSWAPHYEETFHESLRASFNGSKYNYDGFLEVYKLFSGIIDKNYGTGWQQWRDYYVSSPDPDLKSKGGYLISQGFNGGLLKNMEVPTHYPNTKFWVVEGFDGVRKVIEIRELSTSPTAYQLNKTGDFCVPAMKTGPLLHYYE